MLTFTAGSAQPDDVFPHAVRLQQRALNAEHRIGFEPGDKLGSLFNQIVEEDGSTRNRGVIPDAEGQSWVEYRVCLPKEARYGNDAVVVSAS